MGRLKRQYNYHLTSSEFSSSLNRVLYGMVSPYFMWKRPWFLQTFLISLLWHSHDSSRWHEQGKTSALQVCNQPLFRAHSRQWGCRQFILTGAELSRLPLERTIRPRISTPSVVMFPAALTGFSPTTEQSNTTFTEVLLMVTWSCDEETTWGVRQISDTCRALQIRVGLITHY